MNTPEFDDSKIEQAILALLSLFEFNDGRTWKRYDFDVMERLFDQGFISNPKGKSESVYLTEEGRQKGQFLAKKLFLKSNIDN